MKACSSNGAVSRYPGRRGEREREREGEEREYQGMQEGLQRKVCGETRPLGTPDSLPDQSYILPHGSLVRLISQAFIACSMKR